VFLNNGNGTFAAKVDYLTGVQPRAVSVGDFNLDGRPDLAVTNFGSNTVSVYINRASAPTASATEISGQIMTADGAPLGGARVTLSGDESSLTITDTQGFYHFDTSQRALLHRLARARQLPLWSQRAFLLAQRHHIDAAFNRHS